MRIALPAPAHDAATTLREFLIHHRCPVVDRRLALHDGYGAQADTTLRSDASPAVIKM
jgi:hypothetical protein